MLKFLIYFELRFYFILTRGYDLFDFFLKEENGERERNIHQLPPIHSPIKD